MGEKRVKLSCERSDMEVEKSKTTDKLDLDHFGGAFCNSNFKQF